MGLQGRGRELEAAATLVIAALDNRGGACWVTGEPGIGKTGFLAAVAELAGAARVMRGAGREGEAELAWSGLGELLEPLISEGWADALPPTRRAALLGALALDEPDAAVEPYAVLTGALGVLEAAAAEQPLLVLVDDAHWLDELSHLALRFLTRRCAGSALAFVVATRPDTDRPSPQPEVELGPLADGDADVLLADLGVRSPMVRKQLVDELAGVPLLLRAAVEALSPSVLAGTEPLPDELPVPRSVVRWAESRVTAASEAGRAALLVVATSTQRDVATVHRALAAFGVPASAVDAAERDGLLDVHRGEVAVRHPTLRTAVLWSADPADRRSAHAAVAEVVSDPAARCWHRGLSHAAPDEAIASELEDQAGATARRGARMVAARHLELAARLSPEPMAAARRLRRAAESASEHGRDDVAEALLARAEAAGGDEQEVWHRRRLRLTMALQAGQLSVDAEKVEALAGEIAANDPALAAEVLLGALPALVRAVRVDDCRAFASEAAALAERAGDERLARRADVALGVALAAVADSGGPPRLARYREVLADEGAVQAAPFLIEVVAPCLTFFEREPEVDDLFAAIEQDLRAQGAAPGLVQVLAARAMACHRRDLARAATLAQEAVDLAEAIDRPALGAVAASELASSTALIGDRERCAPVVDWLLASGVPGLRQNGRTALGVLSLAEGDLEAALAVFEAQRDEVGLCTGLVRWEMDWCEALILARRPDEAAEVLDAVVSSDEALLAAGGFTRIRGMLAEGTDEAEELFDSARRWYRLVGNRTGEGRTELVWGERLRRARRRGAAREHLSRAVELLEGTGAEVWAVRARRELTVAGGARTAASLGVDALSEQEMVIARLAVAGSTNRLIGGSLFLSPRTVETHLGSVFRKLGVRNRRELSAFAVDEPTLRS